MAQQGIRPTVEVHGGRSKAQALLEQQLRTPVDFAVGIPYTQGQIAALDWLLGSGDKTPLTLRQGVDPEDVREIEREANLATDMLQLRAPMDLRGNHFVAGVEFALMWVRYETVDDEL